MALQVIIVLLVASLWPALPLVAELTEQEARGKLIYLEGTSPAGGEITALMGDPGTAVPASVIPCGGCHGRDGRGRPEGGLNPSNLTWAALTKPYGVDHPGGRKHPPYDTRSLKKAITMGVDPAGHRLHVAMPRYQLSIEDADALVAYIRRLGEDPDPGVLDDAVRLATVLPTEGPLASLGGAMEAVLRASLEDLNRGGGIYQRRLELEVLAAPREAGRRADGLRRLLEAGEVFALVGAFLPGAEGEMTAVVRDLETPLIGPFTLYPQIDFFAPNPWVFYLLPGVEDLGRALAGFAAHDSAAEGGGGEPPVTAVVRGAAGLEATAEAIVERITGLGWPEPRSAVLEVSEAAVEALRAASVERVFLLAGGAQQTDFFRRAGGLGWFPRIYLPGTLAGEEVFEAPAGFARRIFVAYPTLPLDHDPRSVRAYRELAERHDLPRRHLAAQISALSSVRVLVEGLKQAGRELSRARLIEVLEGLVEFDTGLIPPVTYDPNRRVGVRGAYVVAVDLEARDLVPASGFIEVR